MQRAGARLVVAAFAVPLLVGLAGTALQASGTWAPLAGPGAGALDGLRLVLADPRTGPAIALTLFTGLGATLVALGATVLALVSAHGTRAWRWTMGALPPLLAVPHAALAVGLAFLLAPSGWLARLASPWATGWERSPTIWTVPDANGWSLLLGLALKETPFLVLAAAAQLPSLDVDAALRIGRTLGYAPARCWSRLILPRLWPRLRLTFLVVLGFNLSVVDMAIVLGPGHPPTLSVLLVQLVADPSTRAAASAGAVLLALLVAAACLGALGLERLIGAVAARRRRNGRRGRGSALARGAGQGAAGAVLATGTLALLVLPLWSLAARWRFPDALPSAWTAQNWTRRLGSLAEPALCTIGFAAATALAALVAGIVYLEAERYGRAPRLDWLWYVPLLVPQVALLFGWQVAGIVLGVDGSWALVAHAHWVYALPYVVLILAAAWRELDPRWCHAAATLGAGYWTVLWRVRLPLLRRPVWQATAVAVSVSVAQYLPTLLLGAGRHPTLATELVASQGGGDRRAIAALAVLQALLPLATFALALGWPAWRARRLGRATKAPCPRLVGARA